MTDSRDELSARLRNATEILRESRQPDDAWRQRLLEAIDQAPPPSRHDHRRWSVRPAYALAACLVCIVIGGALVKVAERIGAPQAPETLPALTQAVRFEFSAPSARNVSIVGDFNRWQPDALRRSASGRWEIEIPLTPGRYAYSFVVDGHLAPDPLAPRATSEDFGSPSSIRLVRGL